MRKPWLFDDEYAVAGLGIHRAASGLDMVSKRAWKQKEPVREIDAIALTDGVLPMLSKRFIIIHRAAPENVHGISQIVATAVLIDKTVEYSTWRVMLLSSLLSGYLVAQGWRDRQLLRRFSRIVMFADLQFRVEQLVELFFAIPAVGCREADPSISWTASFPQSTVHSTQTVIIGTETQHCSLVRTTKTLVTSHLAPKCVAPIFGRRHQARQQRKYHRGESPLCLVLNLPHDGALQRPCRFFFFFFFVF
ncbi:hypothetical protein QBC32DRAFT_50329 [Pseudoneurospora amorphoporcata]|uniref:Uncharacterized protein n=1 Tax=Pseudoneurospora amorphoporcata TaxID=241081 RepID=A0AAN6NN77_9PEZI|nr:hypothetical protein QBC32DRAFT_50329 [Pseudoneurospora amorphoporcata]